MSVSSKYEIAARNYNNDVIFSSDISLKCYINNARKCNIHMELSMSSKYKDNWPFALFYAMYARTDLYSTTSETKDLGFYDLIIKNYPNLID